MITKEQESVKRLRVVMDDINGVIYTLDALAGERTGATHALRNLARELDRAFMSLDEIAETLEQAHGLDENGGGAC